MRLKSWLTALAAVAVPIASASASPIYVKPGGTGDGSSWDNAIGAIATVGEVWVAEGTYHTHLNLSPGATIYGGFAGNETSRDQRDPKLHRTIITADGGTSVVTALNFSTPSLLDGFTLTGGSGTVEVTHVGTVRVGGAVYARSASVHLANCEITGSSADIGNAVAVTSGTLIMTGCEVHDDIDGGGFYTVYANSSTVSLISNDIHDNAGWTWLSGLGTVSGNAVHNNDAGVWLADLGPFTVTGNRIWNNRDSGVYLDNSGATIANNVISGNVSTTDGGGGIHYASSSATTLVVRDNLVVDNSAPGGAGVSIKSDSPSSAKLYNNTIVGNTSTIDVHYGAVYFASSNNTVFANNIVAFNPSGLRILTETTPAPAMRDNDVYGNTNGDYIGAADPTGTNGNIKADPLFVNQASGNYRLAANSPCIDKGDDSVVAANETDLDQRPRKLGAHVDIGAYEFIPGLPFTMADVGVALRIAGGLQTALPSDLPRLNVVGTDTSANALDVRDAVRLARKAMGLDGNP